MQLCPKICLGTCLYVPYGSAASGTKCKSQCTAVRSVLQKHEYVLYSVCTTRTILCIFSRRFSHKLSAPRLQAPKGVAVDARGRVLVADSRACFVAAFDSADAGAGCAPLEIGEKGNASHQLAGPTFLAVSRANNVLVSDFHSHRIKVRLCGGRQCSAGCQ